MGACKSSSLPECMHPLLCEGIFSPLESSGTKTSITTSLMSDPPHSKIISSSTSSVVMGRSSHSSAKANSDPTLSLFTPLPHRFVHVHVMCIVYVYAIYCIALIFHGLNFHDFCEFDAIRENISTKILTLCAIACFYSVFVNFFQQNCQKQQFPKI